MALKPLATKNLERSEHEHWPQHLEATRRCLRLFAAGARLHHAGAVATTMHADLIQDCTIIAHGSEREDVPACWRASVLALTLRSRF